MFGVTVVGFNSFVRQNRENSGVHPLLLALGDDPGVQEATGLEGHEAGGRRVLDRKDQFYVYRGRHGSNVFSLDSTEL